MVVFECGNWDDGEKHDNCPLCGADVREEQPLVGTTVVINCDGWKM